MARIETWFNQDLQKSVEVHHIKGNVFTADNKGNVIGVNVFKNGIPVNLTGTVTGSIIRADGVTVIVSGTISGNQAYIVLPQSAYAVPGLLSIVIKLSSGNDITTICAVVGTVYMSTTNAVSDPGNIIPDVSALLALINQAEAAADEIADMSIYAELIEDDDYAIVINTSEGEET